MPGRDGLSGAKGEIGEPGPKGSHGPTGARGDEGAKGSTGSPGSPGLKGEEGEINLFAFSAYKTSGGSLGASSQALTYDVVNVGSDVLNKDSGFFTCKRGGTYLFTFSGEAWSSSSDWIGVYLNAVKKMILYDYDKQQHTNLSFTWTLNLEQGDVVYLKIESGNFYADSIRHIFFNGFLLKASD